MITERDSNKLSLFNQELDDESFADEISIEENTCDYKDLYFDECEQLSDALKINFDEIAAEKSLITLDTSKSSIAQLSSSKHNCISYLLKTPNQSINSIPAVGTDKPNINEVFIHNCTLSCNNSSYSSSSVKRNCNEGLNISDYIVKDTTTSDLLALQDHYRDTPERRNLFSNERISWKNISTCKFRKKQSFSSDEEEELCYPVTDLFKADKDIKKRVRFHVSKMEGDLNFRVTLSIKNEANGQTVFYKVDKNRFRKEKTVKLMVDTTYRIDISFKPTQTLSRALIGGQEVKVTERVHDSTASAYSLHLPTSSLQPSVKGHREEITFLIQLGNGSVLQTDLQVKFYKVSDTQHSEWGSTFHCVEYDCECLQDSGTISVMKETFR